MKLGHQVHYVAPQRMQDYAANLFRTKYQRNEPVRLIHYRPYLRLSRKYWQRELTVIEKITTPLLSDQTVFISNDFIRCSAIKELFGAKLPVVYDMYDRYSEYGNEHHTKEPAAITQFDKLEQAAIAKFDLILCASQALMHDTLQWNRKAVWFPNAVPQTCIAQSGGKTPGKILGMLSDRLSRFDQELLIEIAQRLPNYQIELIGKNDLQNTGNYPSNIFFKKYMPHHELLKYISRWDCGLSLYQADRFNRYCCPLKYFEYSSRNLPVITTTIPEGKVFSALYPETIYLADDAQSVIRYIEECAIKKENTNFTRLACENTWEIRAAQLVDTLHKLGLASCSSRGACETDKNMYN